MNAFRPYFRMATVAIFAVVVALLFVSTLHAQCGGPGNQSCNALSNSRVPQLSQNNAILQQLQALTFANQVQANAPCQGNCPLANSTANMFQPVQTFNVVRPPQNFVVPASNPYKRPVILAPAGTPKSMYEVDKRTSINRVQATFACQTAVTNGASSSASSAVGSSASSAASAPVQLQQVQVPVQTHTVQVPVQVPMQVPVQTQTIQVPVQTQFVPVQVPLANSASSSSSVSSGCSRPGLLARLAFALTPKKSVSRSRSVSISRG